MIKNIHCKKHRYFLALLWPICLFLLGVTTTVCAQKKHTVSGYIRDARSGETLLGASFYNKNNKGEGTTTNLYGFYSLTLDEGNYTLSASFIGYRAQDFTLNLVRDTTLHIDLAEEGVVLEQEAVVTAKRKDNNVESTDMGRVELSIEKIKSLPALFGEVDVVRSLQLLPGVKSVGEINSGFYVRGGGPDQNLILLDEAVVYNPGHLFGFFSVFNSDALKNTTLHKASMPAEYGGRLSSVLDVSMKEGNNKQFEGEGGIGLISSRLTLQGPIQKNKGSFLIAGRRTYADILAQPFLKGTDYAGNGYYFYDLNTKINYRFSDKDRLFLSGYFGRDVFNFISPDKFALRIPWGNATTTLRWNHLFNDQLFLNTSIIYNAYNFEAGASYNEFESKFFSGVRDWNAKLDWDYYPSAMHNLKFGLNYTYHTFTPYSFTAKVGQTDLRSNQHNKQHAHELALYCQDDFKVGDRWKIHAGLRATAYYQVGPYATAIYDQNGLPTDSIFYNTGQLIQPYYALEPRLALRYAINDNISLKGGITVANQFIHLVSNSTTTLPTDLWVPSTKRVKPQKGTQYALGYFQNFDNNTYETSVEVYYRNFNNQIEFAESYAPELNTNLENSFVFGKGRSYGIEFFVKKATGRFNGWIGYTLSRTERTFPDINNGQTFPARYDRTHDLSVVANYQIGKRWSLSGIFVYGTGQAFTLPNSYFLVGGWVYPEFDMPRNSLRLPAYHRLDFSAVCKLSKPTARIKSELVLSVYNVYSRLNPFIVYSLPEISETSGEIDVKLLQVSIFPIVPSISWNFKF